MARAEPSPPEPPPSDRSLLRRFRDGEMNAATELYLRYAGPLYALTLRQRGNDLAARVDPEDIVQSVFRTFFRRAAQGEYQVPAGEELWKLLLVIALNKIRATGAYHRAAKRSVGTTVQGKAFEQAARSLPAPDETALGVLRLTLDEALTALPESERRIIELRIEGYQVEEIARTTRRAKRSVERVLQAFRTELSRQLAEE
jgi:RNA polymerase sigma-70 factor (ECF subfamily)